MQSWRYRLPCAFRRLALAQALDLTAVETGTFYVVCRGGLRRRRQDEPGFEPPPTRPGNCPLRTAGGPRPHRDARARCPSNTMRGRVTSPQLLLATPAARRAASMSSCDASTVPTTRAGVRDAITASACRARNPFLSASGQSKRRLATLITPPKRFAMERSHAIAPTPPDRLSKGGVSLILAAAI